MTADWNNLPKRLDDGMAAILTALDTTYEVDIARKNAAQQRGEHIHAPNFVPDGRATAQAFSELTAAYQERVQPYYRQDQQWTAAKEKLAGLLPDLPEIQQRLEKSKTKESWQGPDADQYRKRTAEQIATISEFRTVTKELGKNLGEAVTLHRAVHLVIAKNLEDAVIRLHAAIKEETEHGQSTARCKVIMVNLVSWFNAWTHGEYAPWRSTMNEIMAKQQKIEAMSLIATRSWPGAPKAKLPDRASAY